MRMTNTYGQNHSDGLGYVQCKLHHKLGHLSLGPGYVPLNYTISWDICPWDLGMSGVNYSPNTSN